MYLNIYTNDATESSKQGQYIKITTTQNFE